MFMKSDIRKEAIEKRKQLNCVELSKKIINNLTSLSEYKQSKNIICYYPLKYEVDTKECFNNLEKQWYLPKVNGKNIDICPLGKLKKGSFGIFEPITNPIKDYKDINMIIIPACAADKSGGRIGYGKGYYDRFLPLLNKSCKKVMLIYSDLIYDNIYSDVHDIKVDITVTDNEILRF